jgi:hypothetical protein
MLRRVIVSRPGWYKIRCEVILPNFDGLKKIVEKRLPTYLLGAHTRYVTREFQII